MALGLRRLFHIFERLIEGIAFEADAVRDGYYSILGHGVHAEIPDIQDAELGEDDIVVTIRVEPSTWRAARFSFIMELYALQAGVVLPGVAELAERAARARRVAQQPERDEVEELIAEEGVPHGHGDAPGIAGGPVHEDSARESDGESPPPLTPATSSNSSRASQRSEGAASDTSDISSDIGPVLTNGHDVVASLH